MTNEEYRDELYDLFKKVSEKTDTSFDSRTMDPDDFFYEMEEMKDLVSLLQELAMSSPHLALLKDMSFDRVLSGLIGGLVLWFPPDKESHDGEQLSERVRKELDRCLTTEIPPNRYWCFLHHFEMDQEIFIIDESVRLRQATLLERAYFISQGLDFGRIVGGRTILELLPVPHYSTIRSESERIERIINDETLTEVEYLLTTLRLLNPSSVGVNWVIRTKWYGSFTSSSGYNVRSDLFPAASSRRWKNRCQFDEIDLELLLKLRNRVKEVASMDHADVPRLLRSLRRYNRAICSEFVEDEIIDLWIILETIARKTGQDVASIISELVALTNDNRSKICKSLEFIYYEIRNPLFHGGSFDPKHTSYVDDLIMITSNALRAYLILLDIDGGISKYIQKVKSDREERKKLDAKLKGWIT